MYNPEHFTGGLGDPDHRVDPLVDLAYYPFPDEDVPLVRVDLGGPGCRPVVADTVGDWDQDGIPDGCDPCFAGPHPDVPIWNGGEVVTFQDLDHDGVTDGCDVCPGHDDHVNTNLDGEEVNGKFHLPDGCDPYATARLDRAEALEPYSQASFSGSTYVDASAGLIELDIATNQRPTVVESQKTLAGEMTARRCFCVLPNGTLADDARCMARDVPGEPPPFGAVCIKNGDAAPPPNVDTGLGWLPFRSLRRAVGAPVPPAELDPAACDARRVGSSLEDCSRPIVTYAPGVPATAEEDWARRPGLTWDAWSEITNREVLGDHDVPANPASWADELRLDPPPILGGNWPGWLTTESSNAPCEKGEPCVETGCRTIPTPLGIGYSCIDGALPFGAEGPGGFWTRLEELSNAGPDFADTAAWRRIHDGYLQSHIEIRSGRTSSGFHKFPVLAHRFLAPWIPIERFAPRELTRVLGGTPAVFNVGGVARLALFPGGEADSVAETPLGDAEPFVRTATALALARVAPGGAGEAGGDATLADTELWAFDGATGTLRRIAGGPGGFSVLEELATGLTAERAELAVTPRGDAFLALAASPWRFYRIAGASGAASAAVAELEVPGTWEGSLALLPSVDGARAVGVMSAGIFDKTVAWATLRAEGTSDVHFLPFVPVREGLWFGHGSDAGRSVVLVGGGADTRGSAHSDVYAVDLEAGGDTTLVAADDGAAAIGPDAWVTGTRDGRGDGGWTLRVVPARATQDGSVRYAAYERHPESRYDAGWAPAGGSAHDTPRSDATLAHALAEGTSCELDGAPWYAAPGTWRYDDDPSHPVLQCAQAVPTSPAISLLPRQVSAYALGERALWTVSPSGLERWSLEGGSPQRLQQLPLSLPGKPNARRALAASDRLVATSRGGRLAVFARSAAGDGTFGALGTLELDGDVIALFAGASDVWAVGERRVTHLRAGDGAVTVAGRFELVRYEGDVFARRVEAAGHQGDDEDGDHEHGHGHADHDGQGEHAGHDGDDDLEIVSASLRGPILALALEHELVTLDLRQPERLPTFGSRRFVEKLKAVATDGRFVYLRTSEDEPDGPWHTLHATTRSALELAGHAPARSFAKKRQYAGRYAARLTGVALHVAVGSGP